MYQLGLGDQEKIAVCESQSAQGFGQKIAADQGQNLVGEIGE
jgi:protein involved in polysaccharide export with SLBB domain